MVVVDGARRMINKTIDITVTSVHQTTAGKMIFGRLDERTDIAGARVPQPHAVNDLPRHVENGGRHVENVARHAESLPSSERVPRPVVPEPSREPE
jgi:hypothetical protein